MDKIFILAVFRNIRNTITYIEIYLNEKLINYKNTYKKTEYIKKRKTKKFY